MPPKRRPRAHDGGPQPPPPSVPRVCKFYASGGNCRFGENCKFLHSSLQGRGDAAPTVLAVESESVPSSLQTNDVFGQMGAPLEDQEAEAVLAMNGTVTSQAPEERGAPDAPAKRNPCFAFQKKGWCRKGDSCEYRHDITGALVQPGRNPQGLPNASQVQKRQGDDERRRQAEKLRKEIEKSEREQLAREHLESAQTPEGSAFSQAGHVRLDALGNALKLRRERERFEREWAERERSERERQEREKLERERLERERLERERLERERLEAERLERQRAEEERVAREREAAAARRAEAKEQKRREREEKLAREREKHRQEQEAKRQRESKVTLQFVVQGSNLVTFGPGLGVQSVVPGFDLCKVVIRNLPANVTDKEIINIFKERGVNETMVKLLECRVERGTKAAKILTRREEAEVLSVGLEGLEFRNNTLAFEVEDNTAWGSMKSSASGTDANTLTCFWNAPSVTMVATYDTVEEAKRKARALDRRQVGGRTITAFMNPQPNGPAARYWVEASVKIGNLAPGTSVYDVEALAETPTIRPIKSNNYDQTSFLHMLEAYLRVDGCLPGSLETTELQANTGRMKTTARFRSPEAVGKGADRLNRGIPGGGPKIRVAEQHRYSILISGGQYRAQKTLWDSMTETARGKKAYVRINERRNGQVFVNVEGSEEKEVGELKVRVESLVAGERLGADHWHRTYAYSGKTLFDRVMAETNVLVTVDRRFQGLRLFGARNDVTLAKDIIRQDVERLELMEYTIPVERRSVRFFVATGLPILLEALGEDNVTLDVGSQQCSLKLRGGEDAIKHAQRLVEEAVNAARGGLTVPAQVDGDDGGSPCPICYDTPTHPEVLSCGHSCCEPCLRHYISSAATSDTFPLVCLGADATCNTPISVPIIHRYLTQQRFTVLIDAVFAHYIKSNARKFKYCTTPDCTQIYQCDTDKQFHQCPACFSRICSSCNEEAHEGMTCEQRRIQSDPAEQERLNDVWARTNNVKRCPTCSVLTEKTEGCNHMTCRCGAHWCYVCGKAFTSATIYDHMRAAHGGIHGQPDEPARVAQPAFGGVAQGARAGFGGVAQGTRAGFGGVAQGTRAGFGGVAQGTRAGFGGVAQGTRAGFGGVAQGVRAEFNGLHGRRDPELDWPGANLNFKLCPMCDVLTEKAGGDNHMTCRCGAHWCWECNHNFAREAIYDHMRTAHGTVGVLGGLWNRGQELQQELEEIRRRQRIQQLETERRERERLAEAHRERQRQMVVEAARRQEKKDDSWCSIM